MRSGPRLQKTFSTFGRDKAISINKVLVTSDLHLSWNALNFSGRIAGLLRLFLDNLLIEYFRPTTPANSVPSKRSFSARNYIIDKLRASMYVERGNKAIYIYMNSKALDRAKKAATGWFYLSEAEERALEDDIVTMLEAEVEMTSDIVEDLVL